MTGNGRFMAGNARVYLFSVAACFELLACEVKRNPPNFVRESIVGEHVCRSDNRSWTNKGDSALLIVSSPTCGSCQVAREFSEELYEYGTTHGVPVFFIVGIKAANDSGARALVASGKNVIRENLGTFGIVSQPTYLRIDGTGVIQSKWTGSVDRSQHDRVFKSIVSGASLDLYRLISSDELNGASRRQPLQIVSLSPNSMRPGSKLIPLTELDTRLAYELDPHVTTIVDCGTTSQAADCQMAAMDLAKSSFRDVAIAGLPPMVGRCGRW